MMRTKKAATGVALGAVVAVAAAACGGGGGSTSTSTAQSTGAAAKGGTLYMLNLGPTDHWAVPSAPSVTAGRTVPKVDAGRL